MSMETQHSFDGSGVRGYASTRPNRAPKDLTATCTMAVHDARISSAAWKTTDLIQLCSETGLALVQWSYQTAGACKAFHKQVVSWLAGALAAPTPVSEVWREELFSS